MISRTKTRETLRMTLKGFKKKGVKINYPMTEFRHAIFNTVDACKLLQFCSWTFDTNKKLTICNLFYSNKKIECRYDAVKNLVEVNAYKTINDSDVLISSCKCSCSELPAYVKSFQPKVKIVMKKA